MQKCIDWSSAIGKTSVSTETVLEKCPVEAAVVTSLKRIIYMLDFCALSEAFIRLVQDHCGSFCKRLLNAAVS